MTIGHDDFYDNNWVRCCVNFLNINKNYSLVWGRPVSVDFRGNVNINPRLMK